MKVSRRHPTTALAALAAVSVFTAMSLFAHTSWGQERAQKFPIKPAPQQPAPKPAEKKDPSPSQVQAAPASTLDPEMELKKVEALIGVNDKNADAYFTRACLFELKGDNQRAAADYSRAIELDKGMKDALYNRGLLFARMKRFEEALKDLSELIRLDPSAPDALCNRGSVYFQTGKMDLALADYNAGLKIAPGDPDLLYNRALVYLAKGDKEAATQDLRKSAGLQHDKTRKEFPELAPQHPLPR
jgi:tetratricopeptide (TPR) repeat protein